MLRAQKKQTPWREFLLFPLLRNYYVFFSLLWLVFIIPLLAAKAPKNSNKTSIYKKKPVEFVLVIPSYNNERWVEKNLFSILSQTYKRWHIYYINDCSCDRTKELVETFVKTHRIKNKSTIVHNTVRKGALANLYYSIHNCHPEKIIVTVDGDDYLADDRALETLAKIYANRNVWLTYGDFQSDPPIWPSCCKEYPEFVKTNNSFRKYTWIASHLRTFRAKLFQRIRKEDLMYQGEFYKMTWDMAMMFPMLEMASKNHFVFVKRVMYRYNIGNPINDFRVNADLQNQLDRHIRALPPYQPLDNL